MLKTKNMESFIREAKNEGVPPFCRYCSIQALDVQDDAHRRGEGHPIY